MRIDLDELERLAKAATPGPWIACGPSFGEAAPKYLNEVVVDNPEDDENDGIEVCRAPVCLEDAVSADMEFIGTANPATVLELVRRLRAAEEIEGVLIDALEQCRGRFAYYVQHHLDKGDLDKAAGNEFWAKVADDAIAKAQGLQPCQGHARQQEIDEATARDLATQAGAEWHESFDDECAMNMEMIKRFARLVLATKAGG